MHASNECIVFEQGRCVSCGDYLRYIPQREMDWFEQHAVTGMVMLVAIVIGCAVTFVMMH